MMNWIIDQAWIAILVIVVFAIGYTILNVLREYERGVIFLLGRFQKVKGPGLIVVIPGIQAMVRVDLRTRVLDVPEQDVISRDNVSVKVNAVVYFRVVDAEKAIIQVEDFFAATTQLAQTTLRSVLGQHELDEMLAERERLNADIQRILDAQTDIWGIKVSNVELKHVDLNENMVRAIAKQAEAERMRRAKIIDAEGEHQASRKFLEAAEVLSGNSQALQLRYLTTLHSIAGDRTSTVVFPFPMDLMRAFAGGLGPGGSGPGGSGPGGSGPGGSSPGRLAPGGSDPGESDPGGSDLGESDSGGLDSGEPDPGGLDLGESDPGGLGPGEPDPGGSDPDELDLGGSDPGEPDPGGSRDE